VKRVLALCLVAGMAASVAAERGYQTTTGIVVEAVSRGSAADKAGIQVGDELVGWTRAVPPSTTAIAVGEFHSPFDAHEFELEQLPRSGTSVIVVRQGVRIDASLIPGFWGVTSRPWFSSGDLPIYEAGRTAEKDNSSMALAAWKPLIDRAVADGNVSTAAWLMTRAATALVAVKQTAVADDLFERAANLFTGPQNLAHQACVWQAKGNAYVLDPSPVFATGTAPKYEPRDVEAALAAHERALTLRSQIGPHSLSAAESQIVVGYVRTMGVVNKYLLRSSPDEEAGFKHSGELLREGLSSMTALAPGSFVRARALDRLAFFITWDNTAERTRDSATRETALATADALHREAWSIYQAVAPHSVQAFAALLSLPTPIEPAAKEALLRERIEFAKEIGNRPEVSRNTQALADLLHTQGATEEAAALLENLIRSESASSALVPKLAGYYLDEGDLVNAERVVLDRLQHSQVSLFEQGLLVDRLAAAALDRGDRAPIETLIKRALDLKEQDSRARVEERLKYWAAQPTDLSPQQSATKARETAPEWLDHERSNHNETWDYQVLADAARDRGDLSAAVSLMEAAIKVAPTASPQLKLVLTAKLAFMKRDFVGQERALDDALAIVRTNARGTVAEAEALERAATGHINVGKTGEAAAVLREALILRQRLQPRSSALVWTLHTLGHATLRLGDRKAALEYFEAALDILDDYRVRVGADPLTWSGSLDSVYGVSNDVVGLLIGDGQIERAFNVAERSRGRAMLDMLAKRDVWDSDTVPQPLRNERRQLQTEYDQTQTSIEKLIPAVDRTAIDTGLAHLHEISLRQDDLDRRVAALDPRSAALIHPIPLTLAQARASLDPGTALLSYMAGPGVTYLFVLTPQAAGVANDTGLRVYTLPVGGVELSKSVQAFRTLIEWDTSPATVNRPGLLAQGRALYDELIRPAEARIAGARRLLLSLDGSLQRLPFGALVRQGPNGPQFLIEWKPLHTTTSMSVYADTLRSRRPADPAGSVVAFGDPIYPQTESASTDADVQFLTRRGLALSPLPATRHEVETIGKLFGKHAVTYLGESATETQAKSIDRSARIIHFAVHGVFNDQLPMNSALAFTMPRSPGPGEDNGLLQAWEIFQQVRIDADLVTLSACDSGLGQQVGGEGLVGLTRAFLYAGARTVAA